MKLFVEIKVKWNIKRLVLLDEDYQIIEEISLNKKMNEVEIDLTISKYAYFKGCKSKSDIFILTDSLKKIILSYNKKVNLYDVTYDTLDSNYGRVESFYIKDNKYLEHHTENKKKIDIWYPPYFDSNEEYHLLIMFDSQNIFDIRKVGAYTDKNDPYYSWQVETSIINNKAKIIVLGLETTGDNRTVDLSPNVSLEDINELMLPMIDKNFHGNKLEDIGFLIINRLIPMMKEKYKIKDVSIAGSSMGGLGAHYLGFKYSDVFSKILTLSPASGMIVDRYWSSFYNKYLNKEKMPEIFMWQGAYPGLEQLLYKMNVNFVNNLIECNYDLNKLTQYIELSGNHNEVMWRFAFNYAINKLFR